jgi:hypothetical protein
MMMMKMSMKLRSEDVMVVEELNHDVVVIVVVVAAVQIKA